MARHHDPMAVVARVRRVRERDSLLGLHQAVREADDAGRRLARLQDGLHAVASSDDEPLAAAAYVSGRLALVTREEAGTRAREASESADAIAGAARAHWQADRSRLEAIEALLERRAEQRRQERRVREAREADEVAQLAWVRRSDGGAS